MKYHGQYCNIQIKHTHTQTPDFFTKENSTHQKGIICTTYFIKNAIVLYFISNSFIIWNQNDGPMHMLPTCRICIKPHRIILWNKYTWQNGIWCSPNLSVPLGGGWELAPGSPTFAQSSSWFRWTASSQPPFLPHCHPCLVPQSSSTPSSLLIQTHHQSPLSFPKLPMPASP